MYAVHQMAAGVAPAYRFLTKDEHQARWEGLTASWVAPSIIVSGLAA